MGECRNVQGAQHYGIIIDSTSCKNLGADLPTKIECSRRSKRIDSIVEWGKRACPLVVQMDANRPQQQNKSKTSELEVSEEAVA